MSIKETLETIVSRGDQDFNLELTLESLLPKKNDLYSLQEIDSRLNFIRDEVEIIESQSNSCFDIIMGKTAVDKIDILYRSLHNTQLDVMKLQCDIVFTKEQYDSVQTTCNNTLVQERRDMLVKQENYKKSLQQLKFEPLKDFYERFANYIGSKVEVCQRLSTHQASSYLQMFDWAHYHQTVFLLRACGKAIQDVEKFERLYQSNIDIFAMNFKQPIEQMDLNNFIEFQQAYAVESQLVVTTNGNHHMDLKDLLTRHFSEASIDDGQPLDFVVFKTSYERLVTVTMQCCKLLIDLNMNYIEAHLTDGINIDKLNGGEGASLSSPETQALPSYAFSPQEYITQIGQHLLTLRKQTEQFDTIENESLRFALEYLQQVQNIQLSIKSCKTVTEIIMSCIARLCIQSLLGRTGQSIFSKLTINGRRQLATDALYLDNVLEDLGLLKAGEPNVDKFKYLLIQ